MKVVIMSGIPGAGKSTYVAKHFPDAFVCSADSYHMKGGEYRFDPKNIGEAHATCLLHFVAATASLQPTLDLVVVDNTNTTVAEIAPYYALAEAYGHEVEILSINVSLNDSARNVHGVPLETRNRMWHQLSERVLPSRWKHRWVEL